MKKGFWFAGIIVVVVCAGLLMGAGSPIAQVKPGVDIKKPDIKKPPQLCAKAELGLWKTNSPFGPKDEFPFSGQCANCWKQLGVMNLPDMGVWIANSGAADAPASKAKLVWMDGKSPYQEQSMTVNLPAIPKGEQHLLYIDVPQGTFFQIASPVKLEIDSNNAVDECNEGNNTLSWTFSG